MENFKIDKKTKTVIISINPKIFPLEVIYSAAYMLLDRAHIIIDGNPKKKILVQLKAKKKDDLTKLAYEFNDELINYSVYVVQAARTSGIRQAIVQRALGVVEEYEKELKEAESNQKEEEIEEIDFVEDPLGIAKPWTPEMAKGIKAPEEIEKELEESEEHND